MLLLDSWLLHGSGIIFQSFLNHCTGILWRTGSISKCCFSHVSAFVGLLQFPALQCFVLWRSLSWLLVISNSRYGCAGDQAFSVKAPKLPGIILFLRLSHLPRQLKTNIFSLAFSSSDYCLIFPNSSFLLFVFYYFYYYLLYFSLLFLNH